MRPESKIALSWLCIVPLFAVEPAVAVGLELEVIPSCCAKLSLPANDVGNFTLQFSSDLQHWGPLTSVFGSTPRFEWADHDIPSNTLRRFYRLDAPFSPDAQEASWRSLNYSKYRFRFTRTCFCFPRALSGTVTVINGVIGSVTDVLDDGTGQPVPSNLAEFKSIEQLFELIRQAQQQGEAIVIQHDAALRFPVQIMIDALPGAVDDEVTYSIRDLEPID